MIGVFKSEVQSAIDVESCTRVPRVELQFHYVHKAGSSALASLLHAPRGRLAVRSKGKS